MTDRRWTLAFGSFKLHLSCPLLLGIIIVAYASIGTLYAIVTPRWQVPDEPAHYNYVRSLAEGRGFPVLEPEDYDQDYLAELTSKRFPPELSVEPLEYEDHQPPLYYLVAAPIYAVFGGQVLPLRLLTIGMGAALLAVAFSAVRVAVGDKPHLAVLAAGFIAFIPQHVAMTAGINNDALAELMVAATLWGSIVYLRKEQSRPWGLGVLVGTALLTKTTAYVAAGVAAAAIAVRWRRGSRSTRWALEQLAWVFVPAALISAPWFLRNGMTYGWNDPMGLARHNLVVENQPRSSEWLATYGWWGLVWRLVRTTFQSFWGQFGWMVLPLPSKAYEGLLTLSCLLLIGFAAWVVERHRSSPNGLSPGGAAIILGFSALLTLLAFLWYNLTFVQHQGRYLYPALVPLSTAAALGLNTLAKPLPSRLRPWSKLLLLGGLAAFDVYCLWRIIRPNL